MHPSTTTSIYNLAGLYKNQGKYDDAQPLFERALKVSTEVLRVHAPMSVNNLADLWVSGQIWGCWAIVQTGAGNLRRAGAPINGNIGKQSSRPLRIKVSTTTRSRCTNGRWLFAKRCRAPCTRLQRCRWTTSQAFTGVVAYCKFERS